MIRIAGLIALAVLTLAGPAAAQPPLLELSQQVVPPGATVTVTVIGPPFHFFGVAASSGNAGLGGGFELGPDFTVIGQGQLDADGRAVFSLAVPSSPSQFYVQGATSPDPGFAVYVPTPARTITLGGLVFTGNITASGSGTGFAGVSGGFPSLIEHQAQSVMPRGCEATGLRASVAPPLGPGQQVLVRLRVNGVVDALPCTLTAAAGVCDSGAATQPIAAGDRVAVGATFTAAAMQTTVQFGFLCN
jgi:hypothetical protein